jgi:hypothetical protein
MASLIIRFGNLFGHKWTICKIDGKYNITSNIVFIISFKIIIYNIHQID